MFETVTHMGRSGRIVIPAAYRKALGLTEGAEVHIRLEDNSLRILTTAAAVTEIRDLVASYVDPNRSLSEELLDERRREAVDG